MQGLELARSYFEAYGRPMIDERFPEAWDRIAVGLVGEGSECLGFDDETSQDHDFEPGFCIFVTTDDEPRLGFQLQRAYLKLPKEHEGFYRQQLSPVGGNRHGVIETAEFYRRFLGSAHAPASVEQWLYTPAEMLCTACNGQIWHDGLGEFSAVRDVLLAGYPEDIRRKRLAAHLALAAQAGPYNRTRLLARGERGGACLATSEYVKHMISAAYLVNNRYEPFYKWALRGMRELPVLSELEPLLAGLLEAPIAQEPTELLPDGSNAALTAAADMLAHAIYDLGIEPYLETDLEQLALAVTETIHDGNIRNMPLMTGA